MNLLKHTLKTESWINRAAYDTETGHAYLESKKGVVYRYLNVDRKHWDNLVTFKLAWENFQLDPIICERPFVPEGVTPGSEGSYAIRCIVGSDRKNPLHVCEKLGDVEAAEIFPYQETAA